jgi:hypothetical protein
MNLEKLLELTLNLTKDFMDKNGIVWEPIEDDTYQVKESPSKLVAKILVPDGFRRELSELMVQNLDPHVEKIGPVNSRGNQIGAHGLVNGEKFKFYYKPGGGPRVKNKGDVAEGVLGASLCARFLRRDGKLIDYKDVSKVLKKLDSARDTAQSDKQTAKTITYKSIKDKFPNITDTVTFDVRLSTVNFEDLVDEKKRTSIKDLFDSAIAYANSGEVIDQNIEWFINNKPNNIKILSDGISDQKGTKVDVRIFDGDREISIGKISLKAGGTKTLGQIGKTFEGLEGMFGILFGIKFPPEYKEQWEQVTSSTNKRSAEAVFKVANRVYEYAAKAIKQKLEGDDDMAEKDFMSQFIEGVKYQAVLNEKGVRLLHLSKGEFKLLDFDKLDEVLEDVDFDVYLDRKTIIPKLYVYDKNVGYKNGKLILVRPKIEGDGKVIRHYVEKEDLLVDLINVTKKHSVKESLEEQIKRVMRKVLEE